MELHEVAATAQSPFRCYVRGSVLESEGKHVQTIGFKDDVAVVQVVPPQNETKSEKPKVPTQNTPISDPKISTSDTLQSDQVNSTEISTEEMAPQVITSEWDSTDNSTRSPIESSIVTVDTPLPDSFKVNLTEISTEKAAPQVITSQSDNTENSARTPLESIISVEDTLLPEKNNQEPKEGTLNAATTQVISGEDKTESDVPAPKTTKSDKPVSTDNAPDTKPIDLTRLKKLVVKIDPYTGKKYIFKDGKRIELVPQGTLPLKPDQLKATLTQNGSLPLNPRVENALKGILLKKPLLLNGAQMPKIPTNDVLVNKHNSSVKVDNIKYTVVSLNMKKGTKPVTVTGAMKPVPVAGVTKPVPVAGVTKPVPVAGVTKLVPGAVVTKPVPEAGGTSEKGVQVDVCVTRECSTQTDNTFCDEGDPMMDQLVDYILGEENMELRNRRIIDPNRLRTKEEIHKFSFFNDMRNALNFDLTGNLPIHESVMHNDLRAVQKNCIVLHAIKENVNILNQHGYAPLHLAIQYNSNEKIVKTLLKYGADLNLVDAEGNTAIHLAIEHDRTSLFKILINSSLASSFKFDVCNYEGFTPLILAVLNRSYNDAKLLLNKGADPNVKDKKSGRTALFHAAECHDVDLVELMMQHKADTRIRNFFGTSPHDAMFELDDIPLKIKFCILGRDHQRFQTKRKNDKGEAAVKKPKLETTAVLKKVTSDDLLMKTRKK